MELQDIARHLDENVDMTDDGLHLLNKKCSRNTDREDRIMISGVCLPNTVFLYNREKGWSYEISKEDFEHCFGSVVDPLPRFMRILGDMQSVQVSFLDNESASFLVVVLETGTDHNERWQKQDFTIPVQGPAETMEAMVNWLMKVGVQDKEKDAVEQLEELARIAGEEAINETR